MDELTELQHKLSQLEEIKKRIENTLHIKEIECLMHEGADQRYIMNSTLYRLQKEKSDLEKRFRPRLDKLNKKIQELKEKISKLKKNENRLIPDTTISF